MIGPSRMLVMNVLLSLLGSTLGIASVVGVGWTARNIGIDGSQRRRWSGKTLEGSSLDLLSVRRPEAPICQPCLVCIAVVEVDIQIPVDGLQPTMLHAVEFGNCDTTDL